MSIQVSPSCIYRLNPTKRSKITVAYQAVEHPMVMKYLFLSGREVTPGAIRRLRPEWNPEQVGPSSKILNPGDKFKMAGYFIPQVTKESRPNTFTVKFGVGDGVVGDFGENVAAHLNLVFSDATGANQYTSPNRPVIAPDGLIAREAVLQFSGSPGASESIGLVFDPGTNPQSVTISIPEAAPGQKNALKIEQSVIVHVLDRTNNLICTMAMGGNESIQLSVANLPNVNSIDDIKLLALADIISYSNIDPEFPQRVTRQNGSDGEFTDTVHYRIGDPITDASVSVSSRNP
jgi:hypothetical protein